ncbi:MAG TPA: cyclic-di-AMP receptor [Anaerolineaceae bacterium]|nr:cyclic-di-AMP receptor [Anaerolineaceae bacterium]HPN53787.1 cyclic-di-AMP receptor [Anaerolineaceae bacterium]
MKLIIAIIRDHDSDAVSRALTSDNLRVTLIASTGGFLRRGSSTLLIGVEDEEVEKALKIIRETCSQVTEPNVKKATIFVLKVDEYIHL